MKENCDWETRQEIDADNYTDLSLQNSMRLTPIIASLVDKFVLTRPQNYNVIGNSTEVNIPPHMILIDLNTTGESLKLKFRQIIEEHNLNSDLTNLEKGFHIISWTTEKDNPNVLSLKKLFPEFSKESKQKREDFDCLRKHLFLYDKEKQTLESIRKSILNALIRVLYLEKIKTEQDQNYTKRQLINFLKSQGEEFYENFNSKLFGWCFEIISKENHEEIFTDVKTFINSNDFIGLNWNNEEQYTNKIILNSLEFIDRAFTFTNIEVDNNLETNTHLFPINLSSVHAVKGQTHCATMYIESAYQRPIYETKKIIKNNSNPLLLEEHRCNGIYDKQALKMMYVGFSRPTHLLCFAVLKENIEEHIESIKIQTGGIWEVIEDLIEND